MKNYIPVGVSAQLQYYLEHKSYITLQNTLKFNILEKKDIWEVGLMFGYGYNYKIKTKTNFDNIIYMNVSTGYNFNNLLDKPKNTLNYFLEIGYSIKSNYNNNFGIGIRYDEIVFLNNTNVKTINLVVSLF